MNFYLMNRIPNLLENYIIKFIVYFIDFQKIYLLYLYPIFFYFSCILAENQGQHPLIQNHHQPSQLSQNYISLIIVLNF